MKRTNGVLRAAVALSVLMLAAGSLRYAGYAQALPAPSVDRVGFPTGYRDTFKLFYVFDNFQNRQIRAVYGNSAAASVDPAQPFNFPYGSTILFESYTVQEDASGEPLLDKNGRFIPNALTTLFVMRKERGFGAEYKELRNGEWEYVAYRPDGTYATPPSGTGSCALCHLTGGSLTLTAQSRNISAYCRSTRRNPSRLANRSVCVRRRRHDAHLRIRRRISTGRGAAGGSGNSPVARAGVRHDRRTVSAAEQRFLGIVAVRRHHSEN